MGRRILFIVVCSVLLLPVLLSAQANDGLMTIEELYLQDDVGLRILRTQALSTERAHKSLALEQAAEMVGTADDRATLAILRILATDGSSWQVRVGGRRQYDYPDIRREAVRLVGEVGGRPAELVLREVLEFEREPMVLAEAVYGLGNVGISDGTGTASVLARMINRQLVQANPDNNLMYASLLTIERLAAQGNTEIGSSTLINGLLSITTGPYTRLVRDKAAEALGALRGL